MRSIPRHAPCRWKSTCPIPTIDLQPGMYADVTLEANSRSDALTVPVEAVQRDETTRPRCWSWMRSNRVQLREVQLGIESPNNVEILGGLQEGERVIVGNLGSYQAGEVVKPTGGAAVTGANHVGQRSSHRCQASPSNIRSSS